jgi:small subunit ribosomal protein S6
MMLVLRGDLAEDQWSGSLAEYKEALSNVGDVEVNEWGKRKMAFPMNHVPDGFYALLKFSTDKETLKTVEGRIKLDANVLRHMVVRLEEKATAPVS